MKALTILNYTGKKVGVTNGSGNPIELLPIHGNARCEFTIKEKGTVGRVPIFEKEFKVRGLPRADMNLEKMYIVTREVAEAIGNTRFDLLVPEDGFTFEGAIFYKHLVNA